jgi:hypothetical protein
MSKLLAIPKGFIGFLNASAIRAQLNTTTWLVLGAISFHGLSLLLTQRLALLLAFAALFARIVPTILISTGKIPDEALQHVVPGKTTALFPQNDGSKGSPAGRGFALLIIGVRISHPMGLFAPGAKKTGDYFLNMVKTLQKKPGENGYLGGQFIFKVPKVIRSVLSDTSSLCMHYTTSRMVLNIARPGIGGTKMCSKCHI